MVSSKLQVTRDCAAVVTDGTAFTKVTGKPWTIATVSIRYAFSVILG